MALIVQKFGGSSVADPERIRTVADHVARTVRRGNQVVVAVSAQSSSWCRLEVRGGDDYQPDAVGWDEFVTAGVIERTLQSAMHSADSTTMLALGQ